MSPLNLFKAAINALRQECFVMAEQAGVFLEVDENGNIWLAEDGNKEECCKVYGWNMTHQKLKEIISKKEL